MTCTARLKSEGLRDELWGVASGDSGGEELRESERNLPALANAVKVSGQGPGGSGAGFGTHLNPVT